MMRPRETTNPCSSAAFISASDAPALPRIRRDVIVVSAIAASGSLDEMRITRL